MLGLRFFLTNSRLYSAAGYGFVDFDSPAAAQKAVSSLKATGVQAQMAKVREHLEQISLPPSCYIISLCHTLNCSQWFIIILWT